MILREVRYLRAALDIYTASMRGPDRPPDQLSPEERDEAGRTYYIKPQGALAAAVALARTLGSHPARFTTGLLYAAKLGGFAPKQLLLHLAYFAEAVMVGRWMRENGLTHLHTHYSSTVALLVHEIFGLDISISFHGPDEFENPSGFFIREKVAASTFVRAISQYARSQLMKSSAASDWGRIHVVYMGVDPDALAPRPFRRHPSPLEIICVGRLARAKAQHILIAAVQNLLDSGRDVLLRLVGGGPDHKSLEEDVARRGIKSQVVIHGFTPQAELEVLYQQADIFALPSLAEGVPGVLMEAMAMEIPCVSTWITGIPELIRNGQDGLLVAPSDVEGFSEALRTLVDDPELRLRIGQAGRQRVLERFDLRRNSNELADLLNGSCQDAACSRAAAGPRP